MVVEKWHIDKTIKTQINCSELQQITQWPGNKCNTIVKYVSHCYNISICSGCLRRTHRCTVSDTTSNVDDWDFFSFIRLWCAINLRLEFRRYSVIWIFWVLVTKSFHILIAPQKLHLGLELDPEPRIFIDFITGLNAWMVFSIPNFSSELFIISTGLALLLQPQKLHLIFICWRTVRPRSNQAPGTVPVDARGSDVLSSWFMSILGSPCPRIRLEGTVRMDWRKQHWGLVHFWDSRIPATAL